MRPQHAIALTLVLAGCKEASSFEQIEDPNTPVLVYYTIPG